MPSAFLCWSWGKMILLLPWVFLPSARVDCLFWLIDDKLGDLLTLFLAPTFFLLFTGLVPRSLFSLTDSTQLSDIILYKAGPTGLPIFQSGGGKGSMKLGKYITLFIIWRETHCKGKPFFFPEFSFESSNETCYPQKIKTHYEAYYISAYYFIHVRNIFFTFLRDNFHGSSLFMWNVKKKSYFLMVRSGNAIKENMWGFLPLNTLLHVYSRFIFTVPQKQGCK